MEFLYRAGDERRSRSPPPPAPPSTAGSGSADGHGGADEDPAERVGNSAVTTLRQPDLPSPETAAAAADANELRRQAEKARIRERILREELLAEQWELELEVRAELREQMMQLSWPAALRRSSAWPGYECTPAAALPPGKIFTAANSSLPALALEVHPNASALATALSKRKSPDHAAGASTLSLAPTPSSKKQKKSTLTCTVCGITANGEKAMQDHLNGKVHRKKVGSLPELPKLVPDETEQERVLEAGEEEPMAMETLGDYKPTKFMMGTPSGALNEVTQMDGYLLCELCNVRTADRVTMMCHLQGSKHISNDQKRRQVSSNPGAGSKHISNDLKEGQPSSKPGAAFDKKLILDLEDYSVSLPHTVRRLQGFLLCELCDVKAPSMNDMSQHLAGKKHKKMNDMSQHLAGKKHKNKVTTSSSDASVNVSTGGKEAAKAQPINTDQTAVISDDMAAKVEAQLTKKSLQPKLGNDCELQEMTVAPPKENVATVDSTRTPGTEMMKTSATSGVVQLNNVHDSDSLTMEVDSVMHPLRRVDGLLVCLSCNTKVPSEVIMQSHLAGKKHKRKMALAAARGNNDLSVLATGADEAQDNSSKSTQGNVEAESAVPQAKTAANEEAESASSLSGPQTKNAAVIASMAVDGPVEAQLVTCNIEPAEEGEITEEAEEEHAAADSTGSVTQDTAVMASMAVDGPVEAQLVTCNIEQAEEVEITEEAEEEHAAADSNASVTQAKESVITNDTTGPVKPIKIQVEGKMFTVMQQENGRLSCELCDVHDCHKDSMILHLYTSTHWVKASLAEKKEA